MGKNTKKPIIGFSSLKSDSLKTSYHILNDEYSKAIIQAGGIPYLLPAEKKIIKESLSSVDGIIIEGGPDVHPSYYKEKKIHPTTKFIKERDEFEIPLIQEAYKKNIPIFAICRGIQILNVAFGGSLYQDIPSEYEKPLNHNCKEETLFHSILINEESLLYKILGRKKIKVNTTHHQAVRKVAPLLKVTAMSPDCIIEAIEGKTKNFVLGIQWHPEKLYINSPLHFRLFQSFIKSCKK